MKRTDKETMADRIDKLFDNIDPQVAVCGVLGGIAAAGGVVPPLTRLLTMFATSTGGNTESVQGDIAALIAKLPGIQIATNYTPLGLIGQWLADLLGPTSSQTNTTTTVQQRAEFAGLVASGAMEGILMGMMMKNPELMSTIIKQPAEVLKAIGEILPG